MNRPWTTEVPSWTQVLLSWRMVEEWYQEGLQGSAWLCLNPGCSVKIVEPGVDPLEDDEGHFRCPECSAELFHRCGQVMVPVGEVVPPDLCRSSCGLYERCARYKLHRIWQNELAHLDGWILRMIDSPHEPDDTWGEEVWHVRESTGAPGDGDGV